jgi:uncharacterized protein YraI
VPHTVRRGATLAALGVTAALATAAVATPAQAAETFITGTVEAGLGLNVHSGSPTGTVVDTMPGGSKVTIYCWTTGPTVTATWGGSTWTTNIWDTVDGYTTPSGQTYAFVGGTRVYASDAWINTGGDTSKLITKPC